MTSTPTPIPRPEDEHRPSRSVRGSRGHIGWIVAASLAVGLVVALLLVAAPFIPAEESRVTGAVLCGFAVGWVLLAVLSVRFTDQPQRWAVAPALLMGLGGLVLVVFGSSVQAVLNWVWPPVMLALAIWVIVRVHRQLRSRGARWLLYVVVGVLALASIGGGYETVREAMDARAYPAPGRLIDVGGHRLHLSCIGSGSPTVVLEPGAGNMSSSLGWITPAVGRDTRVCVYDRAGRGWSEPADAPQDGLQIATDLHTLLQRGQVPGPYVLAGHSFGGLYVLTFAARYPDEVAGMALLDSTAPAWGQPQWRHPATGRPTTSWAVSPRWCRVRLGWVWAGFRHVGRQRLAAASPRRDERQDGERQQHSQHDRRVCPAISGGTGGRPDRLRRQAAGRPDGRQRT